MVPPTGNIVEHSTVNLRGGGNVDQATAHAKSHGQKRHTSNSDSSLWTTFMVSLCSLSGSKYVTPLWDPPNTTNVYWGNGRVTIGDGRSFPEPGRELIFLVYTNSQDDGPEVTHRGKPWGRYHHQWYWYGCLQFLLEHFRAPCGASGAHIHQGGEHVSGNM